ncbi:hypothetical protein [Longimicrobium sp.]|uniref:hypothetical protein n=1 Tax=Longimicrobium sp. TaxID=2029185 RepID=UPI002D1D562F|nr:hypothetical protein [Longimicrobium sp.]HSU14654.1 hypothetical protein [Longimicrobium sp.]
MGKIRLALESLAVESFATMPREGTAGTVHANQFESLRSCGVTCDDTCIQTCANTCLNTCGTCNASCYNTCAVSCLGTCQTACGGCGYVSQPPAFYSCRFC